MTSSKQFNQNIRQVGTGLTYMTVESASAYLCLSKATIYDMVHRRRLPFRKHGSRLIFCKADLDAWSDASKVNSLTSSDCKLLEIDYKSPSAKPTKGSLKTEQKKLEATTPKKAGHRNGSM